jgi:hypothetical protein
MMKFAVLSQSGIRGYRVERAVQKLQAPQPRNPWRALSPSSKLRTKDQTVTYRQIAKALPLPATAQYVGAANVLAVAIPCHRVLRSTVRSWAVAGRATQEEANHPSERYIERRGYEDRGGIGFSAPGVSVGIGTDRY